MPGRLYWFRVLWGCLLVCLLWCATVTAQAVAYVNLSGNATFEGAAVNAMVLAGGEYTFSSAADGSWSLESVPLDGEGKVTLYCFCAGIAPYAETFTPGGPSETRSIVLSAPGSEPGLSVTYVYSESGDTYTLTGTVTRESAGVNAMVLAGGEYTFSSAGDGGFTLPDVPLDGADAITLQAFCEGALPFADTFTPAAVDFTDALGLGYVFIPAGTFAMGSPQSEKGRDPNEGPQHTVTLTQSFYMTAIEVTNEQYAAFLNSAPTVEDGWFETQAQDPQSRILFSNGQYSVEAGYEAYPVAEVSWYGAKAMADRLTEISSGSYRLPTEAEWEYSCRAGTQTPWYWGNDMAGGNAVCDDCGVPWNAPASAGSLAPNPWGLYNMLGNVWEWCVDWYDSDYYAESPATDPLCAAAENEERVVRGGSCYNGPRRVRSALRYQFRPEITVSDLGFRLVCLPPE